MSCFIVYFELLVAFSFVWCFVVLLVLVWLIVVFLRFLTLLLVEWFWCRCFAVFVDLV